MDSVPVGITRSISRGLYLPIASAHVRMAEAVFTIAISDNAALVHDREPLQELLPLALPHRSSED